MKPNITYKCIFVEGVAMKGVYHTYILVQIDKLNFLKCFCFLFLITKVTNFVKIPICIGYPFILFCFN